MRVPKDRIYMAPLALSCGITQKLGVTLRLGVTLSLDITKSGVTLSLDMEPSLGWTLSPGMP